MGAKPRFGRVTIYWLDIATHSAWAAIDEVRHPMPCATTGYIIRRSATHVEVALNVTADEASAADVVAIPIPAITRIERLR